MAFSIEDINIFGIIKLIGTIVQDIRDAKKATSDGGKNVTSAEITDIIMDILIGAGVIFGVTSDDQKGFKNVLTAMVDQVNNNNFNVAFADKLLNDISSGIKAA